MNGHAFLWSACFRVYLYENKRFFVFLFIREVIKVEEEITETPTTDTDNVASEPESVVSTDEPETAETVPAETDTVETDTAAAEESVEKLYEEVLNPQLYGTNYVTDDYVITLVHEVTLGDFLIGMLLCVLIVVKIVGSVLGGGRRW